MDIYVDNSIHTCFSCQIKELNNGPLLCIYYISKVVAYCVLSYVGKGAHMSVRALADLGTIVLPVVIGQCRGCRSEYQLKKMFQGVPTSKIQLYVKERCKT